MRELSRARLATTAVFAVTGFVFASWAARIPAVQDRLGLSPGELGVAFLALNAGAVAGLPGGGVLVARIGSRRSLRAGFALYPPALVYAAMAPGLAALTAGLLVMAASNSVIDVALNTQGAELERRYGRPLMSGLHAGHSLGVLGGGAIGAAAAASGIGTGAHFAAAAAVAMVAGFAATCPLLDEPRAGGPVLAAPRGRLLMLGLVGFCAFLAEGAANDWSAVHVRRAHGAGAGTAALAFVAFTLALSIGRLAGDRVVARAGRARAVEGGAALGIAGVALALAAPSVALALVGWAVLGAGVAVMAPTVFGAAATTGTPAPVAIAAVTTVGYLGAFSGPPVIGGLAELTGLTTALALVGVAVLGAGTLARRALVSR